MDNKFIKNCDQFFLINYYLRQTNRCFFSFNNNLIKVWLSKYDKRKRNDEQYGEYLSKYIVIQNIKVT
jgi:hypothetical protein